MKRTLSALLAVLLAAYMAVGVAFSKNQQAIEDGSHRPAALSILGCDTATCTQTVRIAADATTHALLTSMTLPLGATMTVSVDSLPVVGSFEPLNYSIPAGACSGTNLNPSSTASLFFYKNDSTQTVRVGINFAPTVTTGLQKDGLGSMSGSGLEITTFEVCNTGLLAASQSIIFGR